MVRIFGPNQARSQGSASDYNAPTLSLAATTRDLQNNKECYTTCDILLQPCAAAAELTGTAHF